MAQEDDTTTPQIGVKLEQDHTITLGAISITFVKVLEDSRCPKNVNCMWAGQARVEVLVSENGKEPITQEITLGATEEVSKNKTFFKEGDYFIKALTLNPYPVNGEKMGPYSLIIYEGK